MSSQKNTTTEKAQGASNVTELFGTPITKVRKAFSKSEYFDYSKDELKKIDEFLDCFENSFPDILELLFKTQNKIAQQLGTISNEFSDFIMDLWLHLSEIHIGTVRPKMPDLLVPSKFNITLSNPSEAINLHSLFALGEFQKWQKEVSDNNGMVLFQFLAITLKAHTNLTHQQIQAYILTVELLFQLTKHYKK